MYLIFKIFFIKLHKHNFFYKSDINKFKDGIGDKLGNAIQYSSTCIAGILMGLIKGWKLTLVIFSISPLLFISAVLFTKVNFYSKQSFKNFSKNLKKLLIILARRFLDNQ